MSIVVNQVRRGTYFDSVALMRIAQRLKALPGIEEAGLMIGTPSNRALLDGAGVLSAEGAAAGPGDLIIAIRAASQSQAEAALAQAALETERRPSSDAAASRWQPRTLRSAVQTMPDASLALVSVPGDFAAAEAMKALNLGLNVMIFSDNVPIADEVELKQAARERGLLVMGPDCGTAIIGGVPLGFANAVPRGDVGIIGASGTGIQEVSCLLARNGRGVSHAIGTGGRDLKSEVGGLTTLMAIDLLDADPATRHVVLISKPPAADVARRVLDRIGRSSKAFTVCFLGSYRDDYQLPANVTFAHTLRDAADLRAKLSPEVGYAPRHGDVGEPSDKRRIVGLFAGGTLAAEAQFVLRNSGCSVASNAPIPGVRAIEASDVRDGHVILDLGDDYFTRGRPHPMIEPAVRDEPLARALGDPSIRVVLLDVVLGTGGHMDPAGHLARVLANRANDGPRIIASVTGTAGDAQGLAGQIAKLESAGVVVAESNAGAAELAIEALRR